MELLPQQFILALGAIMFLAVVCMHLVRKNLSTIILYMGQSAALALLWVSSTFSDSSKLLFVAIGVTIAVKLIIAPGFLAHLIRKNKLHFSEGTYLSTPLTLAVIAALVVFAHHFLSQFPLSASGGQVVLLPIATMLVSLFLLVNRKGALSQMLGILSIENSIVSFALSAGLEQSLVLQVGIISDLLLWVVIAGTFISMIHRKFNSVDVTAMNSLTENRI